MLINFPMGAGSEGPDTKNVHRLQSHPSSPLFVHMISYKFEGRIEHKKWYRVIQYWYTYKKDIDCTFYWQNRWYKLYNYYGKLEHSANHLGAFLHHWPKKMDSESGRSRNGKGNSVQSKMCPKVPKTLSVSMCVQDWRTSLLGEGDELVSHPKMKLVMMVDSADGATWWSPIMPQSHENLLKGAA